MKKFLRFLVLVLLLLNSAAAIYGGCGLMANPDGSSMNMSLDFLQYSPFKNYFIPGLLLFTVNGMFSLFVFASVIFKFKFYLRYIIAQGIVLIGWISVEILMLQTLDTFHIIFMVVAMLLLICAWILIGIDYMQMRNNLWKID
jgi:hypothetical protein